MNPIPPTPVDESMLRWRVQSFSNRKDNRQPMEYLVELKNEYGLNNCTCEDFQFRVAPDYACAIRSGIPYDMIDIGQCKHIKLCKERFTEIMLEGMLQREKQQSGIKTVRDHK